jgi:hypothetical protein
VSRVGEVWSAGRMVFVILEEDEANAYPEESICVVLILAHDNEENVGATTGTWVPKTEGYGGSTWKRIASLQS